MKPFFFIVFLLLNIGVFAQKAKVLDQETGKFVKNVTIFNELQTITLTTNIDGIIDISSFKNDEIIIFSHLSYAIFQIKKSE